MWESLAQLALVCTCTRVVTFIASIAVGAGQLGTRIESGVGDASADLGGFLKHSRSWWLVGGGVLLVSLVVLRTT